MLVLTAGVPEPPRLVLALVEAVALANLCFVNVWYHVLQGRPAAFYARGSAPSRARLAAACGNVSILAIGLTPIFRYRDRLTGGAGTLAALVVLGLIGVQCLVLYRTVHDHLQPLRRWMRRVLGRPGRARVAGGAVLLAAALVVSVLARYSGTWQLIVWRGVDGIAWLAVPLAVWTLPRALLFAVRGHPASVAFAPPGMPAREPASGLAGALRTDVGPWGVRQILDREPSHDARAVATARKDAAPRPRVVWIVFDELDYGIAFARRPQGLALPHFDAMRAQSVSCTHAIPPAHCTELSMPALVSGLRVAGTRPVSPCELDIALHQPGLTPESPNDPRLAHVRWSTQATVFSRARELGARSAMVGWYHPYARILATHLTWAACYEAPDPAFAVRPGFCGAFADHWRGLLETGRYSLLGQSLAVRKAAAQHLAIREQALRLATAADRELVLLHWPIPHAPYFYDAVRQQPTACNRGPAGYLDNLTLADRSLGEVLEALAASPEQARTTVIVTSDHWWRTSARYDGRTDQRVPFLVRLAGETAAACWTDRFETVRTMELIVAILAREVITPVQLLGWLKAPDVVVRLGGPNVERADPARTVEHGATAR